MCGRAEKETKKKGFGYLAASFFSLLFFCFAPCLVCLYVFPLSSSPCLHQGMAAEKGYVSFCQLVSSYEAKGHISLVSLLMIKGNR